VRFFCLPCSGSYYTSKARKISYPVVLIHGFGDIPALSGSLATVEEALREEAGVPKADMLTVQIPPLNTIEERTKSAIRDITAKFHGKTVHLIAHSMVCFTFISRLSVWRTDIS